MDDLTLEWRLRGPGSALFSMTASREVVEIGTSYVGDGLGSLISAALDLHGGSRSALCLLPAEPGGTALFFGGAARDVYLQVVGFEDMMSVEGRWTGGRLRWHDSVGVDRFCRQVVSMSDRVLASCGGEAAYLKAWGGIPFPVDDLQRLRRGLGE